MEMLIAGDLVPTKSNIDLFDKGDINALLGEELLQIWNSADIRIFNLETPLTDEESPISKYGPNLIAPTSTINGIKKLNPTLITLANNHILDQGEKGFKSTINILNQNRIQFIGAGNNLDEASKPFIIEKDGLKIGIYACAEHEFTLATENSSGANPFDPLESLDHICNLRTKCDYLVVLYHGGKEHYRYPSPNLQRVCRKMVQKGADLVVCQHSHCIGCYEEYQGSAIVYGQGNFLFDHSESEFWKTSILIKININNQLNNLEFIPITKKSNTICLASGQASIEIIDLFNQRSQEILAEGFIEKEYQRFSHDSIPSYLRILLGFRNWYSRIDRKLFNNLLINRFLNKKKLLAIQNIIECEAHRELLLKGIKFMNEIK